MYASFAACAWLAEARPTIAGAKYTCRTRLPAHVVQTTGLSSVIDRRTSNTSSHVSHSYVYAGIRKPLAARSVAPGFYPLSEARVLT